MLRSLKVRHFRCFEAFETQFAPGLNFIVGPNARGKTSLLEAACILLRLQSPRITKLAAAIQHHRRGFALDGFLTDRHLQFYFSKERKKLALDAVEQKSAFEYLELGRVVYFSNADIEIVRGGGEVRRRFMDFIAGQREGAYRTALRAYERALRSRNFLLKAPSSRWNEIMAFEEPLVKAGQEISRVRGELIRALGAPAARGHSAISGSKETLRLEYLPGGGDDFAAALQSSREEDARLRQTSVGPHRDDLRFYLSDQPSEFASEGQHRTLVLALKLGAAQLLEEHFQMPPVLLLDDVFGELDPSRRNALLGVLPARAQKLVTTTHLDWMTPGTAATVLDLA